LIKLKNYAIKYAWKINLQNLYTNKNSGPKCLNAFVIDTQNSITKCLIKPALAFVYVLDKN